MWGWGRRRQEVWVMRSAREIGAEHTHILKVALEIDLFDQATVTLRDETLAATAKKRRRRRRKHKS